MNPKKFFEIWGEIEEKSVRQMFVIYGLVFAVVALCLLCWKIASRPLQIAYIPSAERPGVITLGVLPEKVIGNFAAKFVLTLANFTPETAENVYKEAMKCMSPRLLSRTKSGMESELAKIKKGELSSLFSINGEIEIKKIRESFYEAKIPGIKKAWMGKEEMNNKKIIYLVELKEVAATNINPYGLIVTNVQQPKIEGTQ